MQSLPIGKSSLQEGKGKGKKGKERKEKNRSDIKEELILMSLGMEMNTMRCVPTFSIKYGE